MGTADGDDFGQFHMPDQCYCATCRHDHVHKQGHPGCGHMDEHDAIAFSLLVVSGSNNQTLVESEQHQGGAGYSKPGKQAAGKTVKIAG